MKPMTRFASGLVVFSMAVIIGHAAPGDLLGITITDFGGDSEFIRSLFQASDGRILAAGATNANDPVTGTSDMLLAKFRKNNGQLVTSFGTNGWTTLDFGFGNDRALWVEPDPVTGDIVVAGDAEGAGIPFLALAKFDSTGQLSPTWGAGMTGKAQVCPDSQGLAAFRGPSGYYLVAGPNTSFDTLLSNPESVITEVLADGTLNTSFGLNGCGIVTLNPDIYELPVAVFQDPVDLTITVVVSTLRSTNGLFLYRLNPDGTLDTTFGPNLDGMVQTTALQITGVVGALVNVVAAAQRPNGKIVVVGEVGLGSFVLLLQYHPDGTLDTAFGQNGTGIEIYDPGNDLLIPTAVALDGVGRIIVTGQNATTGDIFVARFRPLGAVNQSFGTSGFVYTAVGGGNDFPLGVLVLRNGKIVVAGIAGSDAFWAFYRGRN